MLEKYKGRIISTITLICAVTLWNSIYYGYYNYPFNLFMDITYTIIIAVVVWWLSSFYDKSRALLIKLSISEEKYKKLSDSTKYVFDNLNQAVFQIDSKGNLIVLNPAWESISDFNLQESLGHNFLTFVYPEDQLFTKQEVLKQLTFIRTSIQEEVRIRKKYGGFIWAEINAKISYDSNGKFDSAVGTLTNITQWKSSERELLQLNENLSIQSDKLGVIAQMSAAIAHEVRNPLTSISGFIQILKEHKQLNDEYVEVIISEIERINLVLSEMLVLSKPQVTSFKKVNLINILNHVIALVGTEANMKSIELSLKNSTVPIWIIGEENQLKQVFINIIKNAVEATESGGTIEIYYIEHNDFISVYVKDFGPGISKEILGLIGQPFYTSKEKGTGLGLTICYKIIETHKGRIHITSEVGVGTTFEIMLPIKQEKED